MIRELKWVGLLRLSTIFGRLSTQLSLPISYYEKTETKFTLTLRLLLKRTLIFLQKIERRWNKWFCWKMKYTLHLKIFFSLQVQLLIIHPSYKYCVINSFDLYLIQHTSYVVLIKIKIGTISFFSINQLYPNISRNW